MLIEKYAEYILQSQSRKLNNGKFTIEISISKTCNGQMKTDIFRDSHNQSMILLVEAESESIALGKRLIDRNIVGF